jgi:hypothetical protein
MKQLSILGWKKKYQVVFLNEYHSASPPEAISSPLLTLGFFRWHVQLVMKIGPYIEELSRTKGAIVEFVNPK